MPCLITGWIKEMKLSDASPGQGEIHIVEENISFLMDDKCSAFIVWYRVNLEVDRRHSHIYISFGIVGFATRLSSSVCLSALLDFPRIATEVIWIVMETSRFSPQLWWSSQGFTLIPAGTIVGCKVQGKTQRKCSLTHVVSYLSIYLSFPLSPHCHIHI